MSFNSNGRLKEISLDEAKMIMLDILIEFDRISKKNNLTYWLAAGTLWGAVQYQGFIPYDDDIDISMPRDDYDKFITVYKKELPSNLFVQTRESDPGYTHYFAKIRNTDTLFVEQSEESEDIKYNQGIFIDIFPVNFIDTKVTYIYPFLRFFGKLLKKNRFYLKHFDIDPYSHYIKVLNKLHGHKNNYIRIEPEFKDGFATVSSLNHLERKDIYPLKEVVFENYAFPIPNDYDKYLRGLYGDYTTLLPPEELEQYRHSSKIYIVYNDEDTRADYISE
ncbi:MAG: hypothetical protein B5M52_05650 [Helicobacteraceae bacterium 4484_230]|nr:MAG: hypothetical protein B5M52_05650 [Helicobacteraceae bacterium 4484_230]